MSQSEKTQTKSRQDDTQALCVLVSYLAACKVPYVIRKDHEESGVDLEIEHRDTKEQVPVSVLVTEEYPPEDTLQVHVNELLSLTPSTVLTGFHRLTSALGWGKPIPVDRGLQEEGRNHDEYLLVIRHSEYRRAPDLDEATLKTYDPTIKFFARQLLQHNARRQIITAAGEDFDSLCQLGRIFAVNFHHKYRNVRRPETDRGFFSEHLNQRFKNAIVLWRRKMTESMPDAQTLGIATNGQIDISESVAPAVMPVLKRDVYRRMPEKAPSSFVYTDLRLALGALDHDKKIAVLVDAAERDSRFIDPEAKVLAARLLRHERIACKGCKAECAQQLKVSA